MPALTITDAAKNLFRDYQEGKTGLASLKVSYFAIGTGTQGSPSSATQLANETFRMAMTSFSDGASAGEAIIQALLSPTVAVGTAITEIGFFGGPASSTPNSGTLFFYAAFSHTHTATESIQFSADSTA